MIIRLTENINSVCDQYTAEKGEELEVSSYDQELEIYNCEIVRGINSSIIYEVCKECAEVVEDKKPEQETSTGGSSKYYDMIINGQPVKAEDVIKCVFSNDFDFGNAFKALVRAHAAKHGGGKAGSTVDYNCEKLKYYAGRIQK